MALTDPLISDLDKDAQRGLLIISRGTAILLLGVYVAYLIFQLKTHAHLFVKRKDPEGHPSEVTEEAEEETPEMSVIAASIGYGSCKNKTKNICSRVCSLVVVTVATSFVADYCEYLTV
jgi:Ca2+:H+ antiporter